MKKRALFLMTALLLMANITTLAQDEHLKLHFDFSQVEGTNVTDAAGGITAKLVGAAKVEQVGNYHVLNLGNASGPKAEFTMTCRGGASATLRRREYGLVTGKR